jgi:hypothetical protein
MDVLLFGMMRAGTTMLANLLTSPPDRLVLVEPGITRGDMGDHVFQQLQMAGLPIDRRDWDAIPDPVQRFERLVRPLIAGKNWGIKEVNTAGLADLLRLLPPRRVVLIVRDIRDIALSALEKVQLQNTPQYTYQVLTDRCIASANAIITLHQRFPEDRRYVIRYEDLTQDAAARQRLADWLDWPLTGDPGQRLDLYSRSYEVARHGPAIGTASVGRHEGALDDRQSAFLSAIAKPLDFYQGYFDYR